MASRLPVFECVFSSILEQMLKLVRIEIEKTMLFAEKMSAFDGNTTSGLCGKNPEKFPENCLRKL